MPAAHKGARRTVITVSVIQCVPWTCPAFPRPRATSRMAYGYAVFFWGGLQVRLEQCGVVCDPYRYLHTHTVAVHEPAAVHEP